MSLKTSHIEPPATDTLREIPEPMAYHDEIRRDLMLADSIRLKSEFARLTDPEDQNTFISSAQHDLKILRFKPAFRTPTSATEKKLLNSYIQTRSHIAAIAEDSIVRAQLTNKHEHTLSQEIHKALEVALINKTPGQFIAVAATLQKFYEMLTELHDGIGIGKQRYPRALGSAEAFHRPGVVKPHLERLAQRRIQKYAQRIAEIGTTGQIYNDILSRSLRTQQLGLGDFKKALKERELHAAKMPEHLNTALLKAETRAYNAFRESLDMRINHSLDNPITAGTSAMSRRQLSPVVAAIAEGLMYFKTVDLPNAKLSEKRAMPTLIAAGLVRPRNQHPQMLSQAQNPHVLASLQHPQAAKIQQHLLHTQQNVQRPQPTQPYLFTDESAQAARDEENAVKPPRMLDMAALSAPHLFTLREAYQNIVRTCESARLAAPTNSDEELADAIENYHTMSRAQAPKKSKRAQVADFKKMQSVLVQSANEHIAYVKKTHALEQQFAERLDQVFETGEITALHPRAEKSLLPKRQQDVNLDSLYASFKNLIDRLALNRATEQHMINATQLRLDAYSTKLMNAVDISNIKNHLDTQLNQIRHSGTGSMQSMETRVAQVSNIQLQRGLRGYNRQPAENELTNLSLYLREQNFWKAEATATEHAEMLIANLRIFAGSFTPNHFWPDMTLRSPLTAHPSITAAYHAVQNVGTLGVAVKRPQPINDKGRAMRQQIMHILTTPASA